MRPRGEKEEGRLVLGEREEVIKSRDDLLPQKRAQPQLFPPQGAVAGGRKPSAILLDPVRRPPLPPMEPCPSEWDYLTLANLIDLRRMLGGEPPRRSEPQMAELRTDASNRQASSVSDYLYSVVAERIKFITLRRSLKRGYLHNLLSKLGDLWL